MLIRSGIDLQPQPLNQLWTFHQLLRQRNETRELTRIIEFRSVVIKHYVDCLIIGKFISLPSPIIDIGTGAGFPGILLKIRYPHLDLVLAEPRHKRIVFLKEALNRLTLNNVKIFEHKVTSRSFQRPMKACITRAVEPIDKTLLRISGSLIKGGLAIFMKGPHVNEELQFAKRKHLETYRLVDDIAYCLPNTSFRRRLVAFERLVFPEIPLLQSNVE